MKASSFAIAALAVVCAATVLAASAAAVSAADEPVMFNGMKVTPAAPLLPPSAANSAARAAAASSSSSSSLGSFSGVQVRPGTRIEDPSQEECCTCPVADSCPCDNPCAKERTKGDLLEDKLEKIEAEITEKSLSLKEESKWVDQVRELIREYEQKVKNVRAHVASTNKELAVLFGEKSKLEAEVMRVQVQEARATAKAKRSSGFVAPGSNGGKEFASEVVFVK